MNHKEQKVDETARNAPDILLGRDNVLPGTGSRGVLGRDFATRYRRGRRRKLLLVTAGAVVAVVGVAAALLAASASHAPSALIAVTNALTKTSAESYNFSLNTTVQFAGREVRWDAVHGAFDHRHELGTEHLTASRTQGPVRAQIRFIGKYVYTWVSSGPSLGTPWNKAPVPPPGADVLPESDLYGFSTERPVNPAELLEVLRSEARVLRQGPASGAGWTGTSYAFTAGLSAQQSVSGTIYVDQQGQIRHLVMTIRQGADLKFATVRDLTFSGFGAPVPVTAPPASQVTYTSGGPYWGFFF
jgi:hypothetical protein